MMIPIAIAEKLHLLATGEQMPASRLKHKIITELKEEGLIDEHRSGLTKSTLYIVNRDAFNIYLFNKYSIADLREYIETIRQKNITRADLVQVSNNSKTIARRTFKGFLVNSYTPIPTTFNGTEFTRHPPAGTFQFIYDFENFIPPEDVIIAGIENPENFRHVAKLQYLFGERQILFVCRYPQGQGKDLIRWLQSIPNSYLHLGDYDFAGINIYLQEYKKYLNDRAVFFIPGNIELLIEQYGNRRLYDQQQLNAANITENGLLNLISLLHKHKKGLEQEALLIK